MFFTIPASAHHEQRNGIALSLDLLKSPSDRERESANLAKNKAKYAAEKLNWR